MSDKKQSLFDDEEEEGKHCYFKLITDRIHRNRDLRTSSS